MRYATPTSGIKTKKRPWTKDKEQEATKEEKDCDRGAVCGFRGLHLHLSAQHQVTDWRDKIAGDSLIVYLHPSSRETPSWSGQGTRKRGDKAANRGCVSPSPPPAASAPATRCPPAGEVTCSARFSIALLRLSPVPILFHSILFPFLSLSPFSLHPSFHHRYSRPSLLIIPPSFPFSIPPSNSVSLPFYFPSLSSPFPLLPLLLPFPLPSSLSLPFSLSLSLSVCLSVSLPLHSILPLFLFFSIHLSFPPCTYPCIFSALFSFPFHLSDILPPSPKFAPSLPSLPFYLPLLSPESPSFPPRPKVLPPPPSPLSPPLLPSPLIPPLLTSLPSKSPLLPFSLPPHTSAPSFPPSPLLPLLLLPRSAPPSPPPLVTP
ncbi:hypothetical protein C7M84_009972 [Penaeus vannamei]|uniref:Uncharacterized protein n=1 Tax=Penaeus vannamei TaxID=6689 RepID=A0A3R7M4K3_PENVA|nr:hypothetical protein C7M84_009972 [Penaeus vannamei]